VAPEVGRVDRHHHFVAETGRDLVIAARAAVGLHGLVRLYVANIEVIEVVAA
jgi:hypothetical protein